MSIDDLPMTSAFATINENGGVDFTAMNKGVTPVFFTVPVADPARSAEDKAPRFAIQEQVRLIVAGDMLNVPTHVVTDDIRERFAEQYRAWKAGLGDRQIKGVPLRQCPMFSPVQIAELEANNIFSVEDLACLSDTNIGRVADGRIWRQKAAAWLEAAKDAAVVTRFAEENERLREDLATQAATLEDLKRQVESLSRHGKGRAA